MAYKTRKELILQIEKLQKEKEKLIDENNSLWFMLDEMDRSNIANPEYFENVKEMMDSLRKARLMTHAKLEEA
tara:strand:- start:419 stop:637 length:219 start_codon:yes stop_codon:yes gene_type:complete